MNFYFLVEDEKSFLKVLPHWFKHMGFQYMRVADIQRVTDNTYILQSGHGVTQLITKALFDTIDTVLMNPGKIDKLIIILDAEELDVEKRKKEVFDQIYKNYEKDRLNFDIEVFVCNHCFETWLLGCLNFYPITNVSEVSDFYKYYNHYDVTIRDPEDMIPPEECKETIGKYHFHYLHELLRFKGIRYTKKKPDIAFTKDYFTGIVKRIETTNQMRSFKDFYQFFKNIV